MLRRVTVESSKVLIALSSIPDQERSKLAILGGNSDYHLSVSSLTKAQMLRNLLVQQGGGQLERGSFEVLGYYWLFRFWCTFNT